MSAGAESHTGIDPDRDTAWVRRLHPGRDDDQALADADRLVVLFPGFHPVLVGDVFVGGFGQRLDPTQIVE